MLRGLYWLSCRKRIISPAYLIVDKSSKNNDIFYTLFFNPFFVVESDWQTFWHVNFASVSNYQYLRVKV